MDLDLSGLHSLYSKQEETPVNKITNRDKQAWVYARYQGNIRRAKGIPSEILEGMLEKEDINTLFIKAMKCLSLLFGEDITYSTAKKRLAEIYEK